MQEKTEVIEKPIVEAAPSVVEATQPGHKSGVTVFFKDQRFAFPLGVIRSRSNLEPKLTPASASEQNSQVIKSKFWGSNSDPRFIDFVFNHHNNFIGVTYSKSLNCFGHDGIADAMLVPGESGSKVRQAQIVGGRICYVPEFNVYGSTEWSGHYGHLWTPEIVKKFQTVFYELTNMPIYHLEWQLSQSEERSDSTHDPKDDSTAVVSQGFFAIKRQIVEAVQQYSTLEKGSSEIVASYLHV